MAVPVFLNNVSSTVQAGSTAIGSATNTGINVATGDGAKFGTIASGQYVPALVMDASTNPPTIKEYVWVTSISTDALTVTRQAETTTYYPASTTTIQAGFTIAAIASQAALQALQGQYKTITTTYTAAGGDRILANAEGIRPPTMLTATAVAGGGAFPGGVQYYYTVTAINASGQESIAQMTNAYCTPAASGTVQLAWTNPPGTDHNRVYRVNAFGLGAPDAVLPGLIFTSAAATPITSYNDLYAVPTPGANPPTSNGAAFTITLPDATTVGTRTISVRAIGNTINLITIQTVSAQTIDSGGTSIKLGQVYGADFQGVTLVSDGSNWQYQAVQPIPVQRTVCGNPLGIASVSPNAYTLEALVGPIVVKHGQRVAFTATLDYTPTGGITDILVTGDWCTSAGVTPTVPGSGNLAFLLEYAFGPGEPDNLSFQWFYDPRQGDINREGSTDSYNYVRLAVFPQGSGTMQTGAAFIDISYGAIGATYYPAGS